MKNSVIIILSILLFGCEKVSTPTSTGDPSISKSGALHFSFDKENAPTAVKTIVATLSRSGYTTLEKTINLTTDTSAAMLFEQVAVGTWKVKVDAKNESGQVLYTGQSDVIVVENNVSQVNLVLSPVSTGVGSIQINVTWGEIPTGIWYDFENNPVLTKSKIPSFQNGVTLPKVVFNGEKYVMWFSTTYAKGGIGYATSLDGITWSEVKQTNIIASDTSWDNGRVVTGAVLSENNQYRMYYSAFSSGASTFKAGLATSSNGITWEKHPTQILPSTSWYFPVVTSDIIKKDSIYLLYFSGSTNYGNRIGLAVSSDGVIWTLHGNGPILQPSFSWEGGSVYHATVRKEGEKYKMIYMGGKTGSESAFGEAISSDGINWQKVSDKPIFKQTLTSKNLSTDDISYPYHVTVGSQKRLYYNGFNYSTGEWTIRFTYLK